MTTSKPRDCGNYGEPVLSRRDLLRRAGAGFGTLALTALLAEDGLLGAAAPSAGGQVKPRLDGRARNIILLFMGGGPSQVDSFDPKPELQALHGKDVPPSIAEGVPKIVRSRLNNLSRCPFEFHAHGKSGLLVSELFPETGKLADDLCIIRSMSHRSPVHAPAEYLATTGSLTGTRPSLGSWLYYGLGSENRDLPGFIVFLAGDNFGGPACWSAGFLPARYQGTVVKAQGIPHLTLPAGQTPADRRAQLDLITRWNARHLERAGPTSELEARIQSYEMAFRMQTAAPEAFDLRGETEETKALYGLDRKECAEYAANCLLARRLVERGVRFVQLNQGGWDAHADLKKNHAAQALKVDRPIAGLLRDLKRRGLLSETLVVWGGEFGRTPTAEGQGPSPGRDHSPSGYSMWLAGGGVRGGQAIGATDPVGYTAVERPIHPNDLHATVLHALGIDQHDLYYEHQNRREIVTFNGGQVVREVF